MNMNFTDLGLNPKLVAHLNSIGFEKATDIQQKVIQYIQTAGAPKKDLVALAQTGTGKTAAFSLPLLDQINANAKHAQALVLSPTRELCLQIQKDIEVFSKAYDGISSISLYGGTSIDKQIQGLKKGPQVIVATPGRCLDLIKRKKLKTSEITHVVFDEADEMLNMGFKPDIDAILSNINEPTIWLFSATMSKEVKKIASKYMKDAHEITAHAENSTAKNIEHHYYVVAEKQRYAALKRILDFNPNIFGLIFCRTKRDTQKTAEKLIDDGYNSAALHGDLTQHQRDSVMKSFRSRGLQILVATDVAARGIDVDKITHVINYQLPDDLETYTHRSGRTARAGQSGISIALINSREGRKIKDIERFAKTNFVKQNIPGGKEICEAQLLDLIDRIKNTQVDEKQIAPFLLTASERLNEFDSEEIIKRFFAVEFNKFLEYYKNAPDLNNIKERDSRRNDSKRGDRRDRHDRKNSYSRAKDADFDRFFIDLGGKDDINKGLLVRRLCDLTGIGSRSIGRIKIQDNFSFIDIEKKVSKKVLSKLARGFSLRNKPANIQPARS